VKNIITQPTILDGVGDEHHPALGDCVGEGSDEGRQRNVGHREEELQQRDHPRRAVELEQLRDRAISSALSASDEKKTAAAMMM